MLLLVPTSYAHVLTCSCWCDQSQCFSLEVEEREVLRQSTPRSCTHETPSTPPDTDSESQSRAVYFTAPSLLERIHSLSNKKDWKKPEAGKPTRRVGSYVGNIHRQLAHSTSALKATLHQPRGQASSGVSDSITPQLTGGSFDEKTTASESSDLEGGRRRAALIASQAVPAKEPTMTACIEHADMDSQKYRLPEHINGNGTKTLSLTKQAHFDRTPQADDEIPPPPISKDTPPGDTTPAEFTGDASSYFNPLGLQRAGSIYTLSRVSFESQLAQLTSLQLPDAELLSTKVQAIPTSKLASNALIGAAEQIRSWISKAADVVSGLDGEDDVEWAAAGGREGLAEVDYAITRFQELIKLYVSAIESLQCRPDVDQVPVNELTQVVQHVDTILSAWAGIEKTLQNVKLSVEIAMEWEELWNTVLGDISNEVDILKRLVFEMEEKRHRSLASDTGDAGVDLHELQTIVEETPPAKTQQHANSRFSVPVPFSLSPNSPAPTTMAQDDSLLALFARMQPLRASLDFLPMRLSAFQSRAEDIFPTACAEIEEKRAALEKSWKALERDAESLRKELGEDRWVKTFKSAGRQAQKMYESVDRSVTILQGAVDARIHLENPASLGKKIESYEAKKMHYGPAIVQILSLIERGVKDRLTVNGEILRLHSGMQRKWDALKEQMSNLDQSLDVIQADKKSQQLRDSISSMLSNDRSTLGSHYDTPGSSPASSVVVTGLNGELHTPLKNGKTRTTGKSGLPQPGSRRVSSIAKPTQLPQRSSISRLTAEPRADQSSAGSSASSNKGSTTPTDRTKLDFSRRVPRPTCEPPAGRPRWNSSVNVKDSTIYKDFKPLSLTTPPPQIRSKPPSAHSNRSHTSQIPMRSPLSRENSLAEETTPSRSGSRAAFRARLSSPGPYSQQVLSQTGAQLRPRMLASKSSMSNLQSSAIRRASYQPSASDSSALGSPTTDKPKRPASSMAAARRISLLPQPRARQSSGGTGRETPLAIAGAASLLRSSGSRTPSADSKGIENSKSQKPWRG